MKTLLAPLGELEEYIELKNAFDKGNTPINVIGGIDGQKCQLIYALSADKHFRLIVTHNEIRAKEIMNDYRMYDKNVMFYPAKDLIFYSADVRGKAIVKERLKVIRAIAEKEPVTIVTTIDAGMDFCIPFENYLNSRIELNVEKEIDVDELKEKLIELGYESTSQVEKEGDFSIRGGIIDIFSMTEQTPFRIELWGDEIDTIRTIDVESQRSIENVKKVYIYPATEIFMSENQALSGLSKIREDMKEAVNRFENEGKREQANRLRQTVEGFLENYNIYHGMVNIESYISYFSKDTVSFFDYFDKENTAVFLDEPSRCIEKAEAVEVEFRESMSGRLEKGYILPKQIDVLYSLPSILKKLSSALLVLLSTLELPIKDIQVKRKFIFNVQASSSYNNNFSMLAKDILNYKNKKYRVLLLSASETRGKRLCEDLMEYDITAFYNKEMDYELLPGEVMVAKGNVARGFEYPDINFVVVTESDIFGTRKKKKTTKKKYYDGSRIHSFNDLKIGDYVVHEIHGLGIYQGIEKIDVDMVTKDYIKVSYALGSNLYVPATALETLQKYASADATKVPKINKLNSPEWKKTKARVREAVEEIAQELVDLYAKREMKKGFQFEKDTVWQTEFEEMFPYDETDDQLKAIEETKKDMESPKIMDRLICGDVGYGKTEIAIRAAFKAVVSGKQVAFLVPTTILAGQHYNTFVQRMKDFGINVELLCRLRTPAEQKRTITGIKKGTVDVVVGTHRLFSKDIVYKNLGLLIVDEEQRFGVSHKEKLKQMKNDIDVLTLSATPIPRTLHMSLVGIRDMSVLEEPPLDRMPIQTFVMEKNDEIVREAILREVARGGQVYYVYNRVANIDIITSRLAKLVPEAVVDYAHGQMNERQLEKTMLRFVEGEIDVLIATTIVESGIDIPNVNTIIIEDADRFGLSQLYQLRGRVGRSNRTAYAFLMYKRDKILKEVAEKRLAAIKEFTELGAGFKISMKDLEIRGAGNLLGEKQHGHMEAVGYDLYCKMLNEAVKRLKGETVVNTDFDTTIDIKVDAFIPVSYIKNEFQKLDVYKRIAEVETEEEKDDMLAELIDRFGDPPVSVENLFRIALLKNKAKAAYIQEISDKGKNIKFTMYNKADIEPARIPLLLKKEGRRLSFSMGKTPYFEYQHEKRVLDEAEYVVDALLWLSQKEEENDK